MQAEHVRGLHIDHQLKFDWLHYRQIGGLRALEDAADINTGLTKGIRNIASVGH